LKVTSLSTQHKRITRMEIEQRLHEFERTHCLATGEVLSSAEFFERYKHGEFDSLFGMEWAAYWRAFSRLSA
jgi:hypothetical protein